MPRPHCFPARRNGILSPQMTDLDTMQFLLSELVKKPGDEAHVLRYAALIQWRIEDMKQQASRHISKPKSK